VEEAERFIGYRITDLVGFKNDLLLAPTIKSNEPARFFNVLTTKAVIKGHHHIRRQNIL
jgi:hypothetical protein